MASIETACGGGLVAAVCGGARTGSVAPLKNGSLCEFVAANRFEKWTLRLFAVSGRPQQDAGDTLHNIHRNDMPCDTIDVLTIWDSKLETGEPAVVPGRSGSAHGIRYWSRVSMTFLRNSDRVRSVHQRLQDDNNKQRRVMSGMRSLLPHR